MESTGLHALLLDLALYAFFGLLCCLFFMSWYLKRSARTMGQQPNRDFMWAEILFRYRDFTKANFAKAHMLYQLAVLLMFFITAVFCSGIVLHGLSQPPLMSIFIGLTGILIFILLAALFFHLAKKKYYSAEG